MKEKLKKILPNVSDDELNKILEVFDNSIKLSHFLSQTHHESQGFKRFEENLNYSAKGLLTTFPNKFTATLAKQYEYQPEKIGNRIYADRMGNGSETTGDGYKYRGRSVIQLTGKNNYKLFGSSIGIDLISNPDLVSTKYKFSAAVWFFVSNNIVKFCDDPRNIEKVTRMINGGLIGLDDRTKLFNYYYSLLQ